MGLGARILQYWDLTAVDLHQSLGENNAWESPGAIAGIPTVKVGLSSANNSTLHEPTQWAEGDTIEHIHRWTAPKEANSVASLPMGVLQLESRLHLWQDSDNHRAKGRHCSISRVGSDHHSTPIKGIGAQTSGPTSPTRGQTPEERESAIQQPVERRPQTQ